MVRIALVGNVSARLFLLPGDIACDALGLAHAERMLVNSLVWTLAGVIAVVIAV